MQKSNTTQPTQYLPSDVIRMSDISAGVPIKAPVAPATMPATKGAGSGKINSQGSSPPLHSEIGGTFHVRVHAWDGSGLSTAKKEAKLTSKWVMCWQQEVIGGVPVR